MAGETNNLDLAQMSPTQNAKSQTNNDGNGQIDAALTASLPVLVDDTNAVTIAALDLQRHVAFLLTPDTPAPDNDITVTLANVVRGLFFAVNNTAEDSEWEISGQSEPAVAIAAGENRLLYSDGDNVIEAAGSLATLGTMAYQNATSVAIMGGSITGMSDPTTGSDVANKDYVDQEVANGGLNGLAACALATTTALPDTPTYNNGTAGVGATLTAGANGALSIDGTAVVASDRVLIKDEAAAETNGVYVVTDEGDGSNPYVLTRATDFDTAAEMLKNSFTFIQGGATLTGSSWLLNASVATVGTDPVDFVQFAGGGGGGSSALPLTRAFVPESSSWTQANFTGASASEKTPSGGLTKALTLISANGSGSGSHNIQALYRAAPVSTPYRIVCGFLPPGVPAQFPFIGFGFYDGTKLLSMFHLGVSSGGAMAVYVVRNNDFTSFSSEPYQAATPIMGGFGPIWFAWENDGTDLKAQLSTNTVDWQTIYSEGVSAWLANRDYLYFGVSNTGLASGYRTRGTMIEWDEDGLNRTLDNVNFG